MNARGMRRSDGGRAAKNAEDTENLRGACAEDGSARARRPIRVGYHSTDYNTVRSIAGVRHPGIEPRRVHDAFAPLRYVLYRAFNRVSRFWQNLHLETKLTGRTVDLHHFFNAVSLSRTPWMVTYETALPRWGTDSEFGLSLLARPECRRILALSQNAYDIEADVLRRHPRVETRIRGKMGILPPPQRRQVASYDDKPLSRDRLEFTFVGGEFFRKGGREALRAAARLAKEGHALQLHVVSNLEPDRYASFTTQEDAERARAELAAAAFVRHYEALPNAEVLALLARSHVGLLPSYAETYGYSVLEAQACGCPVITTDVRALPEINREEVGWVLPVPKDARGYARSTTAAERERLRKTIEDGLYRTMKEICRAPERIRSKGEAALRRLDEEHSPERHARLLEAMYREALAPGGRQGVSP